MISFPPFPYAEAYYMICRNVQSILKSPDLDAKYEKFSNNNSSPKINRRNRLNYCRLPEKSKRKISSASKTRSEAQRFSLNSQDQHPQEITEKYIVGDIIGDGNFAVVRKCFCKKNKIEYALKIIDKSKCKGKEHMIESEVNHLNQWIFSILVHTM